jgi:superfamily II helicase
MKLSEIKKHLTGLSKIGFQLSNGELVASHFHITEVGKVTKDFIDCGGKVRSEAVINFQLWEENDYDHRLHPDKLVAIIEMSEKIFKFDDLEIEVEYQGKETIGKYDLDFDGTNFLLISKLTACLAEDACGISEEKPKIKIANVQQSSCDPSAGCC